MGTDIHSIFQAKKSGRWIDIPHNWDEDRHYFLFAWLGNVRNGFGFAGVPTHEPIKPLSDKRGVPDDFVMVDFMHPTDHANIGPRRQKYYTPEELAEEGGYFMGDHSHSWLSADEILASPPPGTTDYGVITLEQFKAWDGKSHPGSHSGGVFGRDVLVSNPDAITDKTTHVQVSWANDGVSELAYFIDEVKRLREEYGEVRLVFGFDS